MPELTDGRETPSDALPRVIPNESGQKSVTVWRVSADRKTVSVPAESLVALKN